MPDVGPSDGSGRREEGREHGRLCASVNGEWSFVAGHVGVNIAGVDVVHNYVSSGVLGKLSLLHTREGAPSNLPIR